MRMCSDAPAQAMGRFDDRADFVVGELLVESSLDVGEHAAGCHELDRVRTMADLAAHRAATFVHAVANSGGGLHASANVLAKAIDLAMTASGRENGADAEHPRSRNLPLGNGGPQCENNIGITGAHVSYGSETGGQRDCRVVSRIESDLGIGIFDRTQSVSLVELRRQVHVAIDEPRKDEFLAKIDKLTVRRRIDEAARHRLDPLAFDKNALLRFGLYVWIGEQNASVNNLRLRGPSRIVCHGLFRPKLTIFCVTAPSDQRSSPKCLTILDPGAKPDNMIVGRESRSGIAAVGGPGHALCLPGGRIAPSGLPENALDVAGRNTAAAPGVFRGSGAGRQVGRDAPSPKTSLRGDAVGVLG